MEWDDLRYVLAVARSGSFFGAAQLLKVSHTTVGRRINALENDLGTKLFRRTREGCESMDAALRLLPMAERIEREMRAVSRLTSGVQEEAEGIVRIHTGAWVQKRLLIPALPSFRTAHPKVRLHLVGDIVEPASVTAAPMISLRFSVMPGRGDIERALADVHYSVYAPRGMDPKNLSWATNYGGPVMLSTYKWFLDRKIPENQAPLLADDADLIATAIGTGAYKGLIPDFIGQAYPGIDRVTKGGPDLVRTLRAIVGRHVATRPEVGAVLNWVEDTVTSAALRL
ncbi:MAG: LysR family transcriptional regulator [Pseudomonadota bacterium]